MDGSSGLTQSPSQRPHVAYALPQPSPGCDRLCRVPAMLVIAVATALRSARSACSPMHSAPAFPGHSRRAAWRSRACSGATPGRLAQLFWLFGLVHGVVRHFSPCAPVLRSAPDSAASYVRENASPYGCSPAGGWIGPRRLRPLPILFPTPILERTKLRASRHKARYRNVFCGLANVIHL